MSLTFIAEDQGFGGYAVAGGIERRRRAAFGCDRAAGFGAVPAGGFGSGQLTHNNHAFVSITGYHGDRPCQGGLMVDVVENIRKTAFF